MNNTHNVTMRQFAEVNNLALAKLRTLIKLDKNVRVAFTRKNMGFYDRVNLDAWLVDNKHKFNDKNVYKPSENGSLFWCTGRDHYVPIGKRSNKLSLCCIDCERDLIKSRQVAVKKVSTDKQKAVDPLVKANKIRMSNAMAQREIDSINKDNWMEI